MAAMPDEVVGEHEEHADQVRDQGGERRLLDAQVVEDGRRLRPREPARRLDDVVHREPTACRHARDVDRRQLGAELLEPDRVTGDEGLVGEPLAHDHGRHGEQEVHVGAGLHAQVPRRGPRRLGLARIDHHDRARGVLGQHLEGVGRVVATIRDLGIRPEHEEEA